MRTKKFTTTRAGLRQWKRSLRPHLDVFEDRLLMSIAPIAVTSNAEMGSGTLEAAITAVNADPSAGIDTIYFNLPSSGALSISLSAPLPTITHSVLIDGTKQAGYTNKPIVELTGITPSGTPSPNTYGLVIDAGSSTVTGLVINGFTAGGIHLENLGGDMISDSYIGTDISGSTAVPNTGDGIFIDGVGNNTIGGFTATGRDVISGNTLNGIEIDGPGATGNLIVGNFIGTNSSAALVVPNLNDGIYLNLAGPTTIGGTASAAHNVISGNGVYGIEVSSSGSALIQANYVGTNDASNSSIGNTSDGISIESSPDVTIGGNTSGERNVISGNIGDGIHLQGLGTDQTLVLGNYVGTNVVATQGLGNTGIGIFVDNVPRTTIGGNALSARNIISGNGGGVYIAGGGALGNFVDNNYIGTDVSGTQILGQAGDGIQILDAPDNSVGGPGEGNLISGNGLIPVPGFPGQYFAYLSNGISIIGDGATGANSSQNLVADNTIGTDVTGTLSLFNAQDGVFVQNSTANTIGGTVSGMANLISGNGILAFYGFPGYGISINGNGSIGNLIAGNIVGLNKAGNTAVANLGGGIGIDAAINTTIGGDTQAARNIISGNTGQDANAAGIFLTDSASGTAVQGNFIGTDLTGSYAIGNLGNGIYILNASNSSIGGTGPGEMNVISGTLSNYAALYPDFDFDFEFEPPDINYIADGVQISGNGASSNLVQGNYIGTDVTGSLSLENQGIGIFINNASHNTIGGDMPGAGNLISGNGDVNNPAPGVLILFSGSTGNVVQGNMIGTDVTGTKALPNSYDGVLIASAPDNLIGGTTPGARNIISGNAGNGGVEIVGQNASLNSIQGNYIGTDISGTFGVPNVGSGVIIDQENLLDDIDSQFSFTAAPKNTIGGNAAGAGNLISGNDGTGITIDGSSGQANNNLVAGNLVGSDFTGTLPLRNHSDGIDVINGPQVTIGGTTPSAGNVVVANFGNGVVISGSGSIGTLLQGNWIGTNSTGALGLGNTQDGVKIEQAPNTTVGGEAPGAGNVVANNGVSGIAVLGSSGNLISANSMYGNANLGIDLGGTGAILQNHTGPQTDGPNLNQNFPIVTAAVSNSTTGTTIESSLTGTPNSVYTVEFFSSPAPDVSGYGQGQTYIGSTTVTTDQNGIVNFNLANFPNVQVTGGQYITATATDSQNNTSEFSEALKVLGNTTPQADLGISLSATPSEAVVGADLIYTVSMINNGPLTATNVQASFTIPTNTLLADVLTNLGTYKMVGNQVDFSIQDIPPGITTLATVSVLPTKATTLTANATIGASTADTNSSNNSTSLQTSVFTAPNADLAVSIVASDPTPWLNSNLTYTITIGNPTGPTDALGVLLADSLPTNVKLISVATTQGTYSTSGSNLSFALGTVGLGKSVTITVVVSPLVAGTLLDNASVSSDGTDPNPSNNSATSQFVIVPPGTFELSAPTYTFNSTVGTATVTVDRLNGNGGPVSVQYLLGGGTAVAGKDYTPVSGVLNFADGQTTASFTFPVIDDQAFNGKKTLLVSLSSAGGGATIGSVSTSAITLVENHPPAPVGPPPQTPPTGPGPTGGIPPTNTAPGSSPGGSTTPTGPTIHYIYKRIGHRIVRVAVSSNAYKAFYDPFYWFNRHSGKHR